MGSSTWRSMRALATSNSIRCHLGAVLGAVTQLQVHESSSAGRGVISVSIPGEWAGVTTARA